MNGVKWLKAILGLFAFCFAFSAAEASFYNSSAESIRKAVQSQIKDSEALRKRQELCRKTFLMSYEDWKELVKNPNSERSRLARRKAQDICEFHEDSALYMWLKESLTEDETKAHDAFWSHFSLDIEKLKPKEEKAADVFFEFFFPVILEMQFELDEVYGRFFSYEGLSAGEKFIIFQHFQHELKYLAEGNDMPDYLEKHIKKPDEGKKK